MRKTFNPILIFSIIFSVLIFSSLFFNNEKPIAVHVFSDLTQDIDRNKIKKIEIRSDYVISHDQKNRTYKVIVDKDSKKLLLQKAISSNIRIEYFEPPFWIEFLTYNFLYILLLILFICSFFFVKLPGVSNKNKFKVTLDKKIMFNDIAGAEEAKEELQEIIEFLKNPNKFTKIGARIPKGILLCGPPGTGKTLLAKAVSCEAGCNFYYASGSEFEEIYVGLGASRLRSLFDEAKKNTETSIIFIDEIDTIGVKRNKNQANVGDQTLNELLTQLDGFGSNKNVILFAATNRPEALDKALLRPGRLGDRVIKIDLPYLKQREAILKVHIKNIKIDPDINLDSPHESLSQGYKLEEQEDNPLKNCDIKKSEEKEEKSNDLDKINKKNLASIAKITTGFSGADLANVVNEAALLAAKNKSEFVTLDHLKTSVEKISMGVEKKNLTMSYQQKLKTAYHESGHAIIAKIFDENKSIHVITILPRGWALGYVYRISENEKDIVSETKAEMLNDIKVCFGGYIAEKIIFGDSNLTSGPRNDLQQATLRARNIVAYFGMSNLGLMNYDEENHPISQTSLYKVEKAMNEILNNAFAEVFDLLSNKNKDVLHKLAKLLVEKEVLYSQDIETFFTENPVQK